MSAIEHVSFAYELINGACACGLRIYLAIFPACTIVTLQISERPVLAHGDELFHRRVIKIAADDLELLFRITPPSGDVRFA